MTTITARRSAGRSEAAPQDRVYRFTLAERIAHWNHAITCLALLVTGLALIWRGYAALLGPDGLQLFGHLHRVMAIPFTVVTPVLLYLGARAQTAAWVRSAFRLDKDDWAFVKAFPREFFGGHVETPPQDKFNGGEKLNSQIQILGWVVMVITGWMLVFKASLPQAVVAWALPIHSFTAMVIGAAALGHIYMALGLPSSRAGLSGIITGWVSREFAQGHHGKWYARVAGGNRQYGD